MPTLPGRRPSLLLELDLTSPPADPPGDDPVARFRARGRRRLEPTLRALHEAAADRHVVGLVAKVGGGPVPWALMQEIRLGVGAFRRSGKPAIAWAESLDNGGPGNLSAYVLATAFDEIWLQPSGDVGPLGIGIQTTFLRGALDRLGVEPQFEQRHEYKNAADQLLRTDFTEAHRESLDRLAESIFDDAVAAVASGRGLSTKRVREIIDHGPLTAPQARDAGLVDRLGYRDEVLAATRARVRSSRSDEDAELLFADLWHPRRELPAFVRRHGHVALVEARGAIMTGRTRQSAFGRQSGSDSLGAELRAAGDDDRARAVVLRVDSPGGSAVASDTIWREVTRLREAGKPVVVSMGDVAASGGYYIACPADVIVALPATLTGSIGVFGGKLVVRELLERLGLHTGTVQRGAQALMYSARRGFSDDERARLVATIDAVYDDFVAKVAAGRRRPVAEIESVARGRVWTGRDAAGVGLVDELGGLRDAVRIAQTRAGLPDDAPVRPARHLPLVARIGRPRSSEDPRTVISAAWPDLAEVAAALGLPVDAALRLPPIELR